MKDIYFEVSRSNLKECYRVGISIPEWKLVNIVYQLNPSEITRVFDEPNKNKDAKPLLMHVKSILQSNIRKLGHADFETRSAPIRYIDIETNKTINKSGLVTIGIATMLRAIDELLRLYKNTLTLSHAEKNIFEEFIMYIQSRNKLPMLDLWDYPNRVALFNMARRHCSHILAKGLYQTEINTLETKPSFKSTSYPHSTREVFMNAAIMGLSLKIAKKWKTPEQYKPIRHRGVDRRTRLKKYKTDNNIRESGDIMESLKLLYQNAKYNASERNINAYREAVETVLESDPVEYLENVQYILPSSIGIKTLQKFIESHGISIAAYQPIVECIRSCIDNCEKNKNDASLYNEALEFMKSFKNTYRHNFYMFENFRDSLQPNYIEAYYKNFPVLREGKEVNFAKMIERFGESVIPDMLVYASMFGNPMNVMMPFKERYDRIDNTTKLWLEECEKDVFTEGLIDTIKNIQATIRSGLNIDQPGKENDSPSAPPPRAKSYTQDDLPSPLNIITKNIIKDIAISMKKFILEDPQFRSIRDKMTFKNIEWAFDNGIKEFQELTYTVSCPNQIAPGIDIFNLIELYNYTDGAMEFYNPRGVYYDEDIDFMDAHGWFNEKLSRQLAQKIFDVLSKKYDPELNKYGMVLMNQKMIDQHPYIDVKNFHSGEYDLDILIAVCPTSEENAKQLYYSIFNKPSSSLTENSTWNIIHRNERLIQESIILGEEKEISFTESELESIQDLISFKENLITLVESEEERMQLQREVYTLYEAAEDLLDEDVADSVIPMLPGANQNVGTRSINEDWLNNTHNKKTGSMPDYLKNAHDLNWGEDDDAPPKKRPSASDDDKPDDDDDLPSDDKKEKDPLDKIEPFDYDSNKSDSSDDKKDDSAKSSSGHIQNYYYYTYNNSNNTHSTTNTNSYNQSRDDHSRNKRTRSHDYAAGLKEEKQIWELDVPEFDSYQEGFLDSAQKVLSTVSRHVSTVLPKNRMQAVQEYDSAIFQRKMIIPFRQYFGKKSARTKLNESVDSFTEARAVPREYNPGHVLGMSKYDYRNIAMKLARQFGVNVIFMNSSSPINKATVATTGGAFVGCVDERKLLAMARGNKKMMQRLQNEVQQSAEENNEDIIDTLIKQTLGGSRDKGVKKYIFIDIDNMRKHFGSFRNPTALETILRHEIGHIFTLDKISDADFEKYACARPFIMIFNGIIQQLTNLPENKILAFSNLHIYHQLLVEKAANDYARINPAALTRILLGTDAPPPIPGINLNALRDLSVPRNVASIMLTCIASGMYSNENDEALVDNFLLKDSLKKILSPQLYEKLKNIIKENDPKKYAIVFEGSSKAKKNIIPEDKVPKQIIRKTIGEAKQKNKNESVMYEDVLDDQMPKSDNPIQDTMLDLDRKLSSVQQSIKSKAQGVQRTASAIAKPFKRTSQWIGSMIARWKDANENEIKAKMADPHERSGLLSAFKSAVKYGSLMKAGLLLNPIFMFLSISRKWSNRKNTFRIRNEMIGELKAELEIIEEKIRDADHAGDRAAKYKLMRFRNELKKKLIRVGGTPEMKNMI